jgi:hypothetical protein
LAIEHCGRRTLRADCQSRTHSLCPGDGLRLANGACRRIDRSGWTGDSATEGNSAGKPSARRDRDYRGRVPTRGRNADVGTAQRKQRCDSWTRDRDLNARGCCHTSRAPADCDRIGTRNSARLRIHNERSGNC